MGAKNEGSAYPRRPSRQRRARSPRARAAPAPAAPARHWWRETPATEGAHRQTRAWSMKGKEGRESEKEPCVTVQGGGEGRVENGASQDAPGRAKKRAPVVTLWRASGKSRGRGGEEKEGRELRARACVEGHHMGAGLRRGGACSSKGARTWACDEGIPWSLLGASSGRLCLKSRLSTWGGRAEGKGGGEVRRNVIDLY